jgi:hypothetical protein
MAMWAEAAGRGQKGDIGDRVGQQLVCRWSRERQMTDKVGGMWVVGLLRAS